MPDAVGGVVATSTLAVSAVAVPVLSVAGVSLGLRGDVLFAGFAGSIAAMALLNSVPRMGNKPREIVCTVARRFSVSIGSSVTAAYTAPLLGLVNNIPDELVLSVAFVAGAGAMHILPWLIERFGKKGGTNERE